MDDSKIIGLFYDRSEQAIAELSKKYGNYCSKIARNILKNSQDAEECVNDAYLGAWDSIPPQNPNPLITYIGKIVRNLSIAKYHSNTAAKRNSYYDIALDELEDCISSAVSVESQIEAKELTGLLNRFLDTLSRENRAMFVCRYWYADSLSDIAKTFGISANNAAVRLSRTRDKLKEFLREEDYLVR